MVEAVEGIGQVENVLTDLVRCGLCEGVLHHIVVLGQFQHQGLLRVADCRKNRLCLYTRILCLILAQNGFDADNGVQNIRAGISLEGDETVNIKHIIFGCLIGQVTVF